MSRWYVYIAECRDGSLYTGITTNPARRQAEHNKSNLKGAACLRGKRPVKIVYSEKYLSQAKAAKREKAIKNWKRRYKLQLIEKNMG